MDYRQALAFLNSLQGEAHFTTATRKLERISTLLELLGNPQEKYETIHVAGTSGKGSTAQLAAEILSAHGLRTGLHISPHIQLINERMQVDGKFASKKEFAALVTKIAPLCGEVAARTGLDRPTYYETTLAMAFEYFADQGCKFAVIEAGLGGSLDATNVLKRPKAAILTNVSLDHTEILGKTVAKIARDKCGIIKPGTIAITGAEGIALREFEAACRKAKVRRLLRLGKEIIVKNAESMPVGSTFDLRIEGKKYVNLGLSLIGGHQVNNAALAIAAASQCTKLEERPLRKALAGVRVPCRFEVIQEKPLVVLDGAHNPAKAKALGSTLQLFGRKDVVFAIGIAATKDAEGVLRPLAPFARKFVFTKGTGREFYDPRGLKKLAGGKKTIVENTVARAVRRAINDAGPGGLVCVTGSLYVAGEARKLWLSDEKALWQRSLAIRPAGRGKRLNWFAA